MDKETETLQWLIFSSAEQTNDYSNRFFLMMGSNLQWGSNIRAMDRKWENLAHKCGGTISNKISSIFLYQKKKSTGDTLSNRQQGSFALKFGNGKEKEQTYDQIKQRDLPLFS